MTRPCISFASSVVNLIMERLCLSYTETVKHILRYIKRTRVKGILYKKSGHLKVQGFSNVDQASSSIDKMSIAGC